MRLARTEKTGKEGGWARDLRPRSGGGQCEPHPDGCPGIVEPERNLEAVDGLTFGVWALAVHVQPWCFYCVLLHQAQPTRNTMYMCMSCTCTCTCRVNVLYMIVYECSHVLAQHRKEGTIVRVAPPPHRMPTTLRALFALALALARWRCALAWWCRGGPREHLPTSQAWRPDEARHGCSTSRTSCSKTLPVSVFQN